MTPKTSPTRTAPKRTAPTRTSRGNHRAIAARKTDGQQGAVLIIALGVLTIMAVLGTAFAQLMRLERQATENYLEARRMDYLLESALSRVIAELQGSKNFRSYSVYRDNPWLYQLRGEDMMAHGRVDMADRRVSRWGLFARRAGTEQWYNTKVIDCSSQINLNGRQDTLARMLDNLGEAIERSERLKRDGKKITNPFYSKPNRGGRRLRGQDVVQLRRRLPGGKFTTKTQLRQLIGDENYDVIKDFVTCYGWEDPYTYRATDGIDEVPALVGASGVGGSGGSQGERQPPASGAPRMQDEPRFPVNVNTAPEEVLIACLQGVAGRRIFPYSSLGGDATMTQTDSSAQIIGRRVTAQEEIGSVLPRAIFVYSQRLEYEHAKKLADRIISQRKNRPFMTWRTNEQSRQGFEDFIDQLDSNFFPQPNSCVFIDPDQPQNRQVGRGITGGGPQSPVSRMWLKGTALGSSRSAYSNAGLPFHDANGWYFDFIKAVIKANFNPNSRLNRYNPNSPAYNSVDKSDLVWAQDNFSLFKGHTTEFCFDTMGYYEITTQGQIGLIQDRNARARTGVGDKQRGGRGRSSALDMSPPFENPFERRVRNVVQVFGVLRHTNQYHFEKTFRSGAMSSANNRKYVVTYPEPMEALTELFSGGSLRDGRIELTGLLDGVRSQTQMQNRGQLYRTNENLAMAIGFDTRNSQSISRLRRAISGGGQSIFREEVTDALRDVLDPPQAGDAGLSGGGRMNKYYRRQQLLELGSVFSNQETIPRDPEVNKEVIGTDLMPDGFHSSIVRTTHIGSRLLYIPARTRIDQGREQGPIKVGASGLGSRQQEQGNVPYYQGGVAFWVKFDFNGDDPVFSGLVGCTQVIKEVSANGSDYSGSEGTQFYIFKNSRGELRVVRMYYHQAFLHGLGEGGDVGTTNLLPQAPPDAENNPILENLDPRKRVARSDLVVNIGHFRAHEWHHIGIDWNDQVASQSLRLYLDFQEVRLGGGPIHAEANPGAGEAWVRLNERQPRDGLQIGGFIREQGESRFGIFKWFTNSASTGGARSGITVVAKNVKRLMANATIDEFVSFKNSFLGIKPYYASTGAPGYFTDKPAEYANLFEIPVPPHVDFVVLRSLDWTSYYPVLYTDSVPNSIPQPLRLNEKIQCEVNYVPPVGVAGASSPSPFGEPWRTQDPVNRIAGRKVARRPTGLKGNNAELVYRFKFRGAQAVTGNAAGGYVGTPAIDDVTLTYFLPSPRIMLQEEVE